MASCTGTPVLASLCSTSSSAPRLSGALPGNTSTAVISWVSVSTTMAALCPSKRLLLLLCPWRISGSCTDIIRSLLTPPLRLTPSSPSPLLRSMSWSSNCPSNSAPATIRSTLESLSRSNRSFKAALEACYVPVCSVATNLLTGQNFNAEEALAILQLEETKRNGKYHFSATDFDAGRWIRDLDEDHAVLEELVKRIADIGPKDDGKLGRLREFLKAAADERVLIFSEAETTVDYLFEQLNTDGRNGAIAKLSGSNRDQRTSIVSRFAPRANLPGKGQPPDREIRVLIATDVVSEGQNMQDCARVLNYDLQGNPVRLIQRFGRVDRIGSPHDEIHLHNMLPDAQLDEGLGLTGKLSDRIQAFHDLIGLDNKLLSEEEQLNAQGIGVIYDDRELPELDDALDEVADNQQAITLLQNIRGNDPGLW